MSKRNVTVSVDEEAYRRGRMWAAENNSSVSAVVSYCIEHLIDLPVARRAVDSINRRRNSMVELVEAIERLSSQLSASEMNRNATCETVEPDNSEQSEPLEPPPPQRYTEITAY